MIIIVKGDFNIWDIGFFQQLQERLKLKPPTWPQLSDEELEDWRRHLKGWPDLENPENVFNTPYVHVDRAAAVILYRYRQEFPPPPEWGPNTPRDAFYRWRLRYSEQMLSGKYLSELFNLLCGMIDSTPHAVVTGALLGSILQDTRLGQMILFKYSKQPFTKVFLKRVQGEDGNTEPPVVAVVGSKEFSIGELLDELEAKCTQG